MTDDSKITDAEIEEQIKKDEEKKDHHQWMIELRSRFLDNCSTMDIRLQKVVARFFLNDYDNQWSLFFKMMDDLHMSFSLAIITVSKILKYGDLGYDENSRKELIKNLESVRDLRNDLAHNALFTPTQIDATEERWNFLDWNDDTGQWDRVPKTKDEIMAVLKAQRYASAELRIIDDLIYKKRNP